MTQASTHNDNSHGSGHGHDDNEPHVLPLSTYFGVWLALVVLTVVTVAVSRFDFGAGNTIIAMAVATTKATLVALFFMHLLYDNKLNLVILLTSLLFVAVFFAPVLVDLGSRGLIEPMKTRAGYKLATTAPSTGPSKAAQEAIEAAAKHDIQLPAPPTPAPAAPATGVPVPGAVTAPVGAAPAAAAPAPAAAAPAVAPAHH
jgi:cytochrome c oxidase subunit 4